MFNFVSVFFLVSVSVLNVNAKNSTYFQLTVVHLNDFHARFEETSVSSTRCVDDNCIGGFSRVYSAVNSLLNSSRNAVFLNAGDNYQGTLWYNIYKDKAVVHFLNKLATDAYTLGNHEFDDGIEGVIPFLKNINAPVVVANINDTEEPRIQGLYNKSTIVYRDGKKIGIIGVILSSTDKISTTEKLTFTDEVEAVNNEAKYLVEEENCDFIIVLSHCGIQVDEKIAERAGPKIGLIVGGHTHTLLYNGIPPSPDKAKGPYPKVVKNQDGRQVLVVQAALNSKYLGNITLWFDEDGNVVQWEGAPIYLNKSIPQDPLMNAEIDKWGRRVHEYGNTVVGFSKVLLDQSTRRTGESNIGSFLTDSMVSYYVDFAEEDAWTYAAIAIINSGAIRTSILQGNITIYDIFSAQPFQNTIDVGELTGQNIKDFLEYSITPSEVRKYQFHEFLQVSGIRVVFDPNKPEGSRVTRLKVVCRKCPTPVFSNINLTETYRVIMPAFLRNGGDGYTIIKENIKNVFVGPSDFEIYQNYTRKMSPIIQGQDERIILEHSEEIHDFAEFNTSSSINNSFASFVFCSVFAVFYYKYIFFY